MAQNEEHIDNVTMTKAEDVMLDDVLSHARVYLEYGAGASTRKALVHSNISSITSVESDAAFVRDRVMTHEKVGAALNEGRLHFIFADIGPTKMWGHPVDNSRKYLWPNYSMAPYVQGYTPDTILIDGRFRIACALIAALQAPDAVILIHDYKVRPNYFLLERFFHVDAVADTMVKLSLKKDANRRKMARLFTKYAYRPGDDSLPTMCLKKIGRPLKKYKSCTDLFNMLRKLRLPQK